MERNSCSMPCLTKAGRRTLPNVACCAHLIFEQGDEPCRKFRLPEQPLEFQSGGEVPMTVESVAFTTRIEQPSSFSMILPSSVAFS